MYYQYTVLVRTADGTEGGKITTIKAAVGADNNLYILLGVVGDKRLVQAGKPIASAAESFLVA